MDVNVTTEAIGSVTVVHVSGKLDTTTADGFDDRLRQLLDGAGLRLVLDLGGLTYMSSVGLRSLSTIAKQTKASGGALALAAVGSRVQEVLDIVRFTPMFAIAPTVEEAIALVQA